MLSSFVGAGNFVFICTSLRGIAIRGGGGGIGSTPATEACCGAAIEYTDTARPTQVPETGTLASFGIASAGLKIAHGKT